MGIQLVEEIEDKQLQNKIEDFQFFAQYGKFNDLDRYDNIDTT